MRPLALYIHIPFCVRKCPYCDFLSRASGTAVVDRYCSALLVELDAFDEWCAQSGAHVTSVFIGGGTPTLLPPRVLGGLTRRALQLPLGPENVEVTVEANPGTVTASSLSGLRSAGANRLSVGVQSLHDSELSALGRIHNAAEAEVAVLAALSAGFDDVSVDLMFGIPGQTALSFADTLSRVVSWGIGHVSTYALTFEEGTALARQRASGLVEPPSEGCVVDMFGVADSVLGSAGLRRYEVSNFARVGHECRHNLVYWRREDYRGLGASAHSFIDGERFWNHRTVLGYTKGGGERAFRAGSEQLTPDQARTERIMLGLRLLEEGAAVDDIVGDDGTSYERRESKLASLAARGLIEVRGSRARLTPAGLLLADHVTLELVS